MNFQIPVAEISPHHIVNILCKNMYKYKSYSGAIKLNEIELII